MNMPNDTQSTSPPTTDNDYTTRLILLVLGGLIVITIIITISLKLYVYRRKAIYRKRITTEAKNKQVVVHKNDYKKNEEEVLEELISHHDTSCMNEEIEVIDITPTNKTQYRKETEMERNASRGLSNSTDAMYSQINRIDTVAQLADIPYIPDLLTNMESPSSSLPSCKKTEAFESEFCVRDDNKCITTDTKPVIPIEVNQKRCNKDIGNLPTALIKPLPSGDNRCVQSSSPQASHSEILGINRSANVSSIDNSENFATVDLTCDGTHLHCFVDKQLFRKYRDSFKRDFNDTDVTVNDLFYFNEEESDTLKRHAEYVVLTYFLKIRLRAELVQESLVVAIQNKKYCLCRWLLTNYKYDEEFLANMLNKAYNFGNYEIIKSLAWTLTRRFYQKFKTILKESALDIYPAFRCECQSSPEDISCLLKSKKMIVIESNIEVVNIPDKYMNFEVTVFISDVSGSDESSKTQKHETGEILSKVRDLFGTNSHHLKMQKLDGDTASLLFKQHNKLSLICPSQLRSSNYGTNHTIEPIQCIQLYCERKGIIPLGEKHFPKTIKGIQTDVLQGSCHLAATTLRVGDRIGTLQTCGTLGGFYHYAGNFECLLTCAHVLYSLPTLLAPPDDMCHNQGVNVIWDPEQTNRRCGVVIRRIFKHDDPSTTSVDAALVYINSADFAINRQDIVLDINGASQATGYLGMSSTIPFVNVNYCDHLVLCCTGSRVSTVAHGAVTKNAQDVTFQRQTAKDVYFHELGPINGNANGVNIPSLLIAQPAHMQLSVGSLTEKRIFTMYNQMVMNIPLQQGDSGTCIYITGNAPHTGCVGMAIAFCSGLSLVTPIQDIVRAVNM